MLLHMVANIEVHMVADMEVDKVTDKVADMVADTKYLFSSSWLTCCCTWWPKWRWTRWPT